MFDENTFYRDDRSFVETLTETEAIQKYQELKGKKYNSTQEDSPNHVRNPNDY